MSGLSIKELAGIALPTGIRDGVFAMLKAYFDDSGTHVDSEIVSVGGLVGALDQWVEFEKRWAALLAEPVPGKPRLSRFHLSHCNACDGEFSGYNRAESDLVTHEFRSIIAGAGLISTASAIDARAWNQLVVGDVRQWLGDAVDVCVENCLSEALKIAGVHPLGDKIAAVFDRGIWTPRLKEVTDGYTLSLGAPRVVSVTFAAVVDVTPLQGADIAATENYWHAIRVLRDGIGVKPRPHMRNHLDNIRAEGLLIDREQIEGMIPRAKQEMASFAGQPS